MKEPIKQEVSAGGVVYRRNSENSESQRIGKPDDRNFEFLIGKHSGYHKWVLAKGMVEPGESLTETAVREVREEVGVEARIAEMAPLKTIEYFYMADLDVQKGVGADGAETERRVVKYQEAGGGKVRVQKKVVFYLMELETDLGTAGWEMEERKWVGYQEGRELLDFETEREVWEAAGKALEII